MNDESNKTDLLKIILSRYDHYLNSVNVKGRFVIALFTFIAGFLIYNIDSFVDYESLILVRGNIVLVVMSIGICFSGIFFVIKAVFPFLISGNSSKDGYHSLIYFGAVSEFGNDESYYQKITNSTIEEIERDLSNQVYQLSRALEQKYNAIKLSIYHLYGLGIVLIILIGIKIIGEVL